MRKIVLLIALSILSIGCATKKKTYVFDEHIKFDSITYKSDKVIYPSIHDTVYIENPCDSLGKLKPFKQEYITSQGKVSIEGKDGKIRAQIDLKETSTTNVQQDNISKDNKSHISDKEVQVKVMDWRLILALVLSVVLNIVLIWNKFK